MIHLHKPFFYEPSQTWCCGECGDSGVEPPQEIDPRPDPMMADLMAKANDPRYSDEWIGNAFRAAFSLLGPEYAADPEPAAPPSEKAPGVA